MKIKQYLHITDTKEFLRGDYSTCFDLFERECKVDGWVVCGPLEFDVDVDTKKVLDVALAQIDQRLDTARALVMTLENQKKDLMFLEAPQPNLFDHPANLPHDETTAYGIKDGLTGELRDPPEHFSTRNR
jgi:hypothetical protein